MAQHRTQILMLCALAVLVTGCSSAGIVLFSSVTIGEGSWTFDWTSEDGTERCSDCLAVGKRQAEKIPMANPREASQDRLCSLVQTANRSSSQGQGRDLRIRRIRSESLDEPEPIHSFTFEPDAWDLHRTEGNSVILQLLHPVHEETSRQVNCGLKVEFINEKGQRVSSEIVEVLLPSRAASSTAGRKDSRIRSRETTRLEASRRTDITRKPKVGPRKQQTRIPLNPAAVPTVMSSRSIQFKLSQLGRETLSKLP